METLKELKKKYPQMITTSGNNYIIEGLGIYKQCNTPFGIETYWKNFEGNWERTFFHKIVELVEWKASR